MADSVDSILARFQAAPVDFSGASAAGSTSQPSGEEPSLLEAAGRGLKQGVTFDFGDEIEAGLRSAFSDRKYTEIRDEIRAKDKAAQEAHPWGYGLSQALGGVATGLATGGAAGAAAKLGTAGVATLAGAEGALGAAGASEADLTKGEVGKFAKDTAVGAGTGAILGAGLHKVFGNYVDTAVERRARHLTEDIGEGAVPTVKRRLGQVTVFNEATDQSLAVNVLDSDKPFLQALKKGQKEAKEVTQERLEDLGKTVKPLYDEIDRETGGVPLGRVVGHMDAAISGADLPGNANITDALRDTRNDFLNAWRRKLDLAPDANLDAVNVPSQSVRQWVTRLRQQATTSMGSLSETERKVVKDEIHGVAHEFLKGYLDDVAKAVPSLEPTVSKLMEANRKILVYASVQDALKGAVQRKAWGPQNFRDVLASASLPGMAAIVAGGADVASGGAAFAATKAAQAAGRAVNRASTQKLAALVRAVQAGNASKATVLEAIKAGVPIGTVGGILNSWRGAPDWVHDMTGDTAASLSDAVTE